MKDLLLALKKEIETNLDELNNCPESDYVYGEKTAYVDCLEIIKSYDTKNVLEIDYDIEKKYPL